MKNSPTQGASKAASVRTLIGCLVAIGAAGCYWGPKASTHSVAVYPTGTIATVLVVLPDRQASLTGELLSVDADGLMVRTNENRIVNVLYEAIDSAEFHDSKVRIANGGELDEGERNELRLLSRFPQGMSSAVLDTLLQSADPAQLLVYRRENGQ